MLGLESNTRIGIIYIQRIEIYYKLINSLYVECISCTNKYLVNIYLTSIKDFIDILLEVCFKISKLNSSNELALSNIMDVCYRIHNECYKHTIEVLNNA